MKKVKRDAREMCKGDAREIGESDVRAGWKRGIVAATMLLMTATAGVQAQEKAEITVGADLVSSYVWRGVYQSGVSFQPEIGVEWKGFSLGAWGSTDFDTFKEFDLSLGYAIGGLSLAVTDYWWYGNFPDERQRVKYFRDYGDTHLFEGTIAYTFGECFPLTASWSTFFAGADKKYKDDGSTDGQLYSTYIELSYPFSVGDIDLEVAVGAAPWKSTAWLPIDKQGFRVANISLTAAKTVPVTKQWSLPVFAQISANPATDDVNLVFGISF